MLTIPQIKRILTRAIGVRILIVAATDKTAMEMKQDILDFVRNVRCGGCLSAMQPRNEIRFNGGYQDIWLYSEAAWRNKEHIIKFDGDVYITNHTLTVDNIRGDVKQLTELFGGIE